MTPRLDNWPARLNAYVEARRDLPFAWGAHDCCMFAAGGLQAITGLDLAAQFRRRYRSAEGAAKVLREYQAGVKGIPRALGLATVTVKTARRGDVVAHKFAGRNALGLCLGPTSAFAGPTGLVFVNTLACSAAWRL